MTQTPVFSVPATEFVRAAARRRLLSAAWLPGLLLLAAAVAGFADSRYWFVGLMILFIVYPMALSMAWFALVGHPSMNLLLRPQRWTADGDRLRIDFFCYPTPGKDDDGEEPDVKETVTFPASILEDADCGRSYAVVPAPENENRIKFLLIPAAEYAALTTNDYVSQSRL